MKKLRQRSTTSRARTSDNRRRLKVYPSGVVDEFFYTADSAQLLVEVGNDDPLWPTLHPTEEYVWLGG